MFTLLKRADYTQVDLDHINFYITALSISLLKIVY